jgi:hypothetical protein
MKRTLLATVAVLALTSSAYAAVNQMSAAGARGTAQRAVHAPPEGMTTLYDQNIGDGSYGWFSQTLSSYPQYDEYLADDFVVPAGHTWKVQEVDATGFYYNGPGPAKGVNILIWKSRQDGTPNTKNGPAVECDKVRPKIDDAGYFQIKLPKSCMVSLTGRGKNGTTYWLTVQANLKGFDTSGYWAWLSNVNVANNEAEGWYYGGGNAVADPKCLKRFETVSDCNSIAPIDLAFALLGKDSSP